MCFLVSLHASYKLNFLLFSQEISLTYFLAGCVALTLYLACFQSQGNSKFDASFLWTWHLCIFACKKYSCFLPSFIYFLTLMVLVKTLLQVPEKLFLEKKTMTWRLKISREHVFLYDLKRTLP